MNLRFLLLDQVWGFDSVRRSLKFAADVNSANRKVQPQKIRHGPIWIKCCV